MNVTSKIVKADSAKQNVFGWAYVAKDAEGYTLVDGEGDFIEHEEDLEDVAYNYALNFRDASDTHIMKGVGTMIESIVFTPEKAKAMGIPPGSIPELAWWVGFHVEDARVWKGIEDQEYTSFSIGGKGTRTQADPPAKHRVQERVR